MTSFIKTDLELLKKYYDIVEYEYHIEKGAGKRFIKWMIRNRNRYDFVYIWFGDIHATISVVIAKLLGKKCIIVAGGYDTTYIPEIEYGFLSTSQRRIYAWVHYSLSDTVITTSDYIMENLVRNVGIGDDRIITIPLGLNSFFWKMDNNKKSSTAVTVASISSHERMKLKGITTVIETGKQLPSVKFEIIGVQDPIFSKLKRDLPANVSVINLLDKEKLCEHYRRASVYLQLSMSEAFGSALSEAMLCECIPIGTDVGGIPSVIGDTGYYVPYGDAEATVKAIKEALIHPEKGKLARERISTMFPLEKREKALVKIIDCLLSV